jgi:hypothetical protein
MKQRRAKPPSCRKFLKLSRQLQLEQMRWHRPSLHASDQAGTDLGIDTMNRLAIIGLLVAVLFGTTSSLNAEAHWFGHHDNGLHLGWYKHSNPYYRFNGWRAFRGDRDWRLHRDRDDLRWYGSRWSRWHRWY